MVSKQGDILTYDILKNEIPQWQQDLVAKYWPIRHLERTSFKFDFIPDQKIKLLPREKNKILNTFFAFDVVKIRELFGSFIDAVQDNKKFIEIFYQSLVDENYDINITDPQINDIYYLLKPVFHKIYVKKSLKEKQLCFNKNQKVNINGWLDSYNKYIQSIFTISHNKNYETPIPNPFVSSEIASLKSLFPQSSNFDIDLFSSNPMYLYITSKPTDILSMSISNFYDSCQNFYSGGSKENLLANIFDPNMKICYFIFDVPYTDVQGHQHPFTVFSRAIIRNMKKPDGSPIIFLDRGYPDRIQDNFEEVLKARNFNVTKNTRDVVQVVEFDYREIEDLQFPYFDTGFRREITFNHVDFDNLPEDDVKQREMMIDKSPSIILKFKTPKAYELERALNVAGGEEYQNLFLAIFNNFEKYKFINSGFSDCYISRLSLFNSQTLPDEFIHYVNKNSGLTYNLVRRINDHLAHCLANVDQTIISKLTFEQNPINFETANEDELIRNFNFYCLWATLTNSNQTIKQEIIIRYLNGTFNFDHQSTNDGIKIVFNYFEKNKDKYGYVFDERFIKEKLQKTNHIPILPYLVTGKISKQLFFTYLLKFPTISKIIEKLPVRKYLTEATLCKLIKEKPAIFIYLQNSDPLITEKTQKAFIDSITNLSNSYESNSDYIFSNIKFNVNRESQFKLLDLYINLKLKDDCDLSDVIPRFFYRLSFKGFKIDPLVQRKLSEIKSSWFDYYFNNFHHPNSEEIDLFDEIALLKCMKGTPQTIKYWSRRYKNDFFTKNLDGYSHIALKYSTHPTHIVRFLNSDYLNRKIVKVLDHFQSDYHLFDMTIYELINLHDRQSFEPETITTIKAYIEQYNKIHNTEIAWRGC